MSPMKSTSTEKKLTPSTQTFLPENIGQSEGQQVVRPKLLTVARAADRTFRYVTVFLPASLYSSIKGSDYLQTNRTVESLISSGVQMLRSKPHLIERPTPQSVDWSSVTSLISTIDRDIYKESKDIAETFFGGNVSLALGHVVSLAMSEQERAEWPRPYDLRHLRILAGLSVPEASKIVSRSQSTVRETEIGTNGTQSHRIRMAECIMRWIVANNPSALQRCGQHALGLLDPDGFVYTKEATETVHPSGQPANREYQEVTNQMT